MSAFLLINFTRPEKTLQSLEAIKEAETLFLYCDGPKEKTREKTQQVQKILQDTTETRNKKGLETHLRLEEKNHGPKGGPLHAIEWFFQHVPQGHIVEDDIILAPNFEKYHDQALARISSDENLFCVAEGHPLENCPYQWIPTKMARLVAWSTTAEKIRPLLKASNTSLPTWKEKRNAITAGLHPKTRVFLWKEFRRLEKNPEWSWHYSLMIPQLNQKLKGLTPTTRLHQNLGIDGSGANCINLFGEEEKFSSHEIKRWEQKKKTLGENPQSETTMEIERYGRIHQAVGRKLYHLTPSPLKFLWLPKKND